MSSQKSDVKHNEAGGFLCPQCGTAQVETIQVEETFDHGGRKKPIRVTARLPIKHCRKCDFSFEDWETEEARHRAACAHVGVQSPAEIRAIRKKYDLSQKAFAQLTRLGGATLNRWERSHLIQNGAYDDYLYLLGFPENLERLKDRRRFDVQSDDRRFRLLRPTAEQRRQASTFRLTAASRPSVSEGNRGGHKDKVEASAGGLAAE
jgi:putative zinc finger/helix-turn-helix YgiT family protein